MSLPISQTSAIVGAVRAVRDVAGRLSQVTGFDQVLRGDAPSDQISPETLIDRTIAAIQDRLSQAGIEANPPLRLNVLEGGRLQLAQNTLQERAAQIEAILAGDRSLREWVSQLHAVAGGVTLTIHAPQADSTLTRSRPTDTINGPPGGYANW